MSNASDTEARNVCTLHGGEVDGDLVPWSGQRLCWDCVDQQLDLIALACQESLEVSASRPWLDTMADEIVSEMVRIAGESDDGLALMRKVVERTRFIAGYDHVPAGGGGIVTV